MIGSPRHIRITITPPSLDPSDPYVDKKKPVVKGKLKLWPHKLYLSVLLHTFTLLPASILLPDLAWRGVRTVKHNSGKIASRLYR